MAIPPYVIGIDLAAKPTKCSGFAAIDLGSSPPSLVKLVCLSSDDSIVSNTDKLKPLVVAIDSPLMRKPSMRNVDKTLIRTGSRVFPPSFSWMKQLSLRGWHLSVKLMKAGYEVIETHPRSVLMFSGVSDALTLLKRLGIEVKVKEFRKKDLLDASIAAAVAYCVINNCFTVIDDGKYKIYLIKRIGGTA